jgi:uncharacterized protein
VTAFVRVHTDPAEFRAAATPLLLRHEAEHNLLLGLVGRLTARPGPATDAATMLTVVRGDETVAAALMTPPSNLVLSLMDDAAARALAEAAQAAALELPGVHAAPREARAFAARWSELTGCRIRHGHKLGIYRLAVVRTPAGVEGAMRLADENDRVLAERWMAAFSAEALGEGDRNPLAVDRWLGVPDGGLFLWEVDGDPVAMAGAASPTGSGIRVSAVYTPPAKRRHGYAGALVAAVSREMQRRGYRWCFLYTDLTNPTSNRVYQRIGYEPIAEAADLHFDG